MYDKVSLSHTLYFPISSPSHITTPPRDETSLHLLIHVTHPIVVRRFATLLYKKSHPPTSFSQSHRYPSLTWTVGVARCMMGLSQDRSSLVAVHSCGKLSPESTRLHIHPSLNFHDAPESIILLNMFILPPSPLFLIVHRCPL